VRYFTNHRYIAGMSFLRAWFAGSWWESLIKTAVILVCCYVVIDQLQTISNVHEQKELILKSISEKSLWFLVVVLLMPLNWFVEALKWWVMMRNVSQVTFLQSIQSTLMGVAAGVATPWRSGEFIGRLFSIDEKLYLHSFYFSMLGGMAQAFVTASVGLAFLPAFLPSPFVSGFCVGISIALLVAYFHFDSVSLWLPRMPIVSKYLKDYSHAKHPPLTTLFVVLLLSGLRYGIYTLQWVLIANMLGVSNNHTATIAAVCVSLLLQSIAPALPLLDIAVRSGIALFVFAMISENTIAIVVSTVLIWMLNLATPALLGSMWMLHDGYSKRRKVLDEKLTNSH
jgi:hypothetical protein